MALFDNDPGDRTVFNFGVDETAQAYLLETARWAKFLAIVGFISLGLLLLLGIFTSTILSSLGGSYPGMPGLGGLVIILYVVIAVLYFFPTYYLFKFSVLIKPALLNGDQQGLTQALAQLRNAFRFIGILTLVFLGFYALAFMIGIIAGAMN